MKPRLIDAAAFVIGVIAAVAITYASNGHSLQVWMVLYLLCPGAIAALSLYWLFPLGGPAGLGFIAVLAAVINGLVLALASYLVRAAASGHRVARIVLVLGVATWLAWYVHWGLDLWSHREPPIAPVDLASPFTGRWEGVLHAERGDTPVVFVPHPHTDGMLDGYLYMNGHDFGEFEEGRWAGDSLDFEIVGFQNSARRAGVTLAMESRIYRHRQPMELRFVSADTSRPVLTPGRMPPPAARRRTP